MKSELTITAQALDCSIDEAYFLLDRNVIEVSLAFSIVERLSTEQLLSPITNEPVAFANSSKVKLLCFDTNQTVMKPQKQQHLTLTLHHQ